MKIAIIGNSGGGKTALARKLGKLLQLPLTHVDSIQFLAGMKIRPHAESIAKLLEIQNQPNWIIDGYGPLDILEERLQQADKIIFIDLPLWRHTWWLIKRQIQNAFSQREELPDDCGEFNLAHTKKLFRSLKVVHEQMRPEMIKILNRDNIKDKVVFVRKLRELNQLKRSMYWQR